MASLSDFVPPAVWTERLLKTERVSAAGSGTNAHRRMSMMKRSRSEGGSLDATGVELEATWTCQVGVTGGSRFVDARASRTGMGSPPDHDCSFDTDLAKLAFARSASGCDASLVPSSPRTSEFGLSCAGGSVDSDLSFRAAA